VIWFVVVVAVPPNVQTWERVADFTPEVVGFPRRVTVQVPPPLASPLVPQVSAVIVKFVASEIVGAVQPFDAEVPEFVRVKTWVPEFDPTFTSPKSWVRGLQASTGSTPFTTI
jgi:hypothetical protein